MLQNIGIKKSLDVVRYPYALAKREWVKCKKQKSFPQKMNATVIFLVWLQNSNSDIQLANSSWFVSAS